jgi:hypothetical protein
MNSWRDQRGLAYRIAPFVLAVLAACGDGPGPGNGNGNTDGVQTEDPPGDPADADQDGFDAPLDCDDSDPAVNPDAAEVAYDGVDNDCDPATLDDDLDGDGFLLLDDCDDANPDVHPGADEYCGEDRDCDGETSESNSVDAPDWYRDADGDGWGDSTHVLPSCVAINGYVGVGGDCDDNRDELQLDDVDLEGVDTCDGDCNDLDPAVLPGATETCNGVDDDCARGIDDGFPQSVWYDDLDGDGYGNPLGAIPTCLDLSATRVLDGTDCDDAAADLNHDDIDADGFDTCSGDCDDADPAISPAALDLVDGVDTNCDGEDGVVKKVWVAERYTGDVWVVDRATGAASIGWSGLGEMIGIARATDGRLWVSRYAAGTVAELEPDGTFTDVFTGFLGPHALNFDPAAGTLLLADWLTDEVYELDPADGSTTVLARGLADPISALRIPGSTDVWVAQRASADLVVIDAGGGVRVGATLPRTGTDTLVAADGMLFAVGQYALPDEGPVYVVDPSTGASAVWSQSLSDALDQTEICLDPGGPGILATSNTGGGAVSVLGEMAVPVELTSAPVLPWQCVGNLPVDGDGDGAYAARVGGDDCDDADPAVFPGQQPALLTTYADVDGDGYGDPASVLRTCDDLSAARVTDGTDCDDASAAANHDDVDGDGIDTCAGDCDDLAADVFPGAVDDPDGIDQNCDGQDGFASTVWVAERSSGEVWVIDSATGAASVGWSGLGEMIGIARAPDGRSWVSRYAAGTVAELLPNGAFVDAFTGFVGPHGLNYDVATGTLLLADWLTDSVYELDPADGSTTVLAAGLLDPISAVRFPGQTDTWVAQRGSADVLVIDAKGAIRVGATLPRLGTDTLVVADGRLYATGQWSAVDTGAIYEIDPLTGAVTAWADALPGPEVTQTEICLDPAGPGLLVTYGTGGIRSIGAMGVPVVLSSAPVLGWQCVGNAPVDADGDGAFAIRVGGDDCDDGDPAVFPGQGC